MEYYCYIEDGEVYTYDEASEIAYYDVDNIDTLVAYFFKNYNPLQIWEMLNENAKLDIFEDCATDYFNTHFTFCDPPEDED